MSHVWNGVGDAWGMERGASAYTEEEEKEEGHGWGGNAGFQGGHAGVMTDELGKGLKHMNRRLGKRYRDTH